MGPSSVAATSTSASPWTHISPATSTSEEIDYHGQERGYYRQIEGFLAAVEAQDQSLVRSLLRRRRKLPRRHPRRQPLTRIRQRRNSQLGLY